jgi:hypothetical protein
MITTHIIDDFNSSDNRVQVTFTNEHGNIHQRYINIPYDENGEVNQQEFEKIIQQQIKGCEYKESLGVIKFIDPNDSVDLENP